MRPVELLQRHMDAQLSASYPDHIPLEGETPGQQPASRRLPLTVPLSGNAETEIRDSISNGQGMSFLWGDQEQLVGIEEAEAQETHHSRARSEISPEVEEHLIMAEALENEPEDASLVERGDQLPFVDVDPDQVEIRNLYQFVDLVCHSNVDIIRKSHALEHLSRTALQPGRLQAENRKEFVRYVIHRGIVDTSVALIETGSPDLVSSASNFLADLAFCSDLGSRTVLGVFHRIARCYTNVFETSNWDRNRPPLMVLEAAVLLCVNVAAPNSSGHQLLVPLVEPICLQIIKDPRASDKLRGNTITLLANLCMTVGEQLRSLGIAQVLLDLVFDNQVTGPGRSVAESVIIYLHGDRKCEEIDRLLAMNVIGEYCVPLMEVTLKGTEFRGMYPFLMYSVRLFQVLAQSRDYAEALVADERVVPLLLQAVRTECQKRPMPVESDVEGRRLALEALLSVARFGLWPSALDNELAAFRSSDLPLLMADDYDGIRSSAARFWAHLNSQHVLSLLLVGKILEGRGHFPPILWREKILSYLFPFLSGC